MTTQTVPAATTDGVPWFEADNAAGNAVDRFELSCLPFSVGRSKSTDLILDSEKISRVHARVVRVGDELCIRDTGSTNGTFVNGKRIEESPLHDGDWVAFANIKFHFCSPPTEEDVTQTLVMDETRTLVMGDDEPTAEREPNVRDVINRVRQMHEIITHRAFSNKFLPVARLEDQAIIGMDYLGIDDNLIGSHSDEFTLLMETDCPLTHSMYEMLRLAATEDFAESQRQGLLFLNLRDVELAREDLLWELSKLVNVTARPEFLVVGIPFPAVFDVPHFQAVFNYIRSLELRIAYTEFDGSHEQINKLGSMSCDFLKLADSLTRDIESSVERQEQLAAIVKAAMEQHVIVIPTGIASVAASRICCAAGCDLGEGPLFGAT